MFEKAIDKTPQSSDRTMQTKSLSMQAQNITKFETKFALARPPELNKAMSLIRKQPLTP